MVGWTNTRRVKKQAENRRRHHELQINAAADARQKLWAACGWLLSEALHAGALDQATEHVLTYIHDLREGEKANDRHDYAA